MPAWHVFSTASSRRQSISWPPPASRRPRTALRAGARAAPGKHLQRAERRADEAALHAAAPERGERQRRLGVLDAFGRYAQAEILRDLDERAHDPGVERHAPHVAHERRGQFRLVERKLREIA